MRTKKPSLLISSFESMGDLTLEQKIDRLGQEIMANAFALMERIGREGKKASKVEIELQEELVRHFNVIKSTYNSLIKMGRITPNNKNNGEFDKGLLDRVKEAKSTVGNIVTNVPKH